MIEYGNSVALLALLVWPLVVFVLFRALTPERALIWSILGAYMALPQLSEINFPGIPGLNKETIPNLAAFGACMFIVGRRPRVLPDSVIGKLVMVMFLLSPTITALTNMEPVQFGVQRIGSLQIFDATNLQVTHLPGLRLYDSASALANQILTMLPFFLAHSILNTSRGVHEILVALVVAGMIYALPILFEVRFSPQLHTWIYGFFQHDFAQAMRGGGFRPLVFMPHGIWLAFFVFMCTVAAFALMKMAPPTRKGYLLGVSLFMVVLVILCKTYGAMALTLVFVPILLFLRPRHHLAIASLICVVVLAYPTLRGTGTVPTDSIVAQLAEINPDRAESLAFRFNNEDLILAHVEQKQLFGWGGWGRFIPHDPETGLSRIVVDGTWIIAIGHFGWLGYLALFGLLTLPLLTLWWHARKPFAPPVPLSVSAVALILGANLLDMMPNDTLIPFTWLMAGAILGYAEALGRAGEEARLEALRARRRRVSVSGAVEAREGSDTPGRTAL